jgi:hypothetical protein
MIIPRYGSDIDFSFHHLAMLFTQDFSFLTRQIGFSNLSREAFCLDKPEAPRPASVLIEQYSVLFLTHSNPAIL